MLPPDDAFSNVANTWLHKLLTHTSNQYSNSFFLIVIIDVLSPTVSNA